MIHHSCESPPVRVAWALTDVVDGMVSETLSLFHDADTVVETTETVVGIVIVSVVLVFAAPAVVKVSDMLDFPNVVNPVDVDVVGQFGLY